MPVRRPTDPGSLIFAAAVNPDFKVISEALLFMDNGSDAASAALKLGISASDLEEIFRKWCGTMPGHHKLGKHHRKRVVAQLSSHAAELFPKASVPIYSAWPVEFIDGSQMPSPNHLMYSCGDSPFGTLLLVSDDYGLRSIRFSDDVPADLNLLSAKSPVTEFVEAEMPWHGVALRAVGNIWAGESPIPLVFKGTEFQLQVWKLLAGLPYGGLSTYGSIAVQLGDANGSRAVGSAVGSNPWAGVVPCHRVVQGDGGLSGFAWGVGRKAAMLAWEAQTT